MKKILFIFFIFLNIHIFSEDIRPIRDNIGFFWKSKQVNRLMNYLESIEKQKFNLQKLIAGISPHDDYLYAARVYYPLFKNFKTKEVVIFGVTHGMVRRQIGDPKNKLIFDKYKFWKGPYKKIQISGLREFLKNRLKKDFYIVSNKAYMLEHSIEAMIPFLQYFNPDIKITPIMITGMDFKTMDEISNNLSGLIVNYIKINNLKIGKDIFFLISTDANHYGKDFNNNLFGKGEQAHNLGTINDKKIAKAFLSKKISKNKIERLTLALDGKINKDFKKALWCGRYSIPFGMLVTLKVVNKIFPDKHLEGKILRYSDTYSEGVLPVKKSGYGITAPFSLEHWVGFLSAGFYLK